MKNVAMELTRAAAAVAAFGGSSAEFARGTSPRGVFGYLEGNPAPVSAETIARHLCDSGYLGILFRQTGQPLNVGRDERLFTRDQRQALAVRDGGCRWPGCKQPPSWSEAHHIENWSDLGLSNIDQAILLCTLHHLLLHNRHWKIVLRGGLYCLQPPIEIDPTRTLIDLPSKNPLLQPPLPLPLDLLAVNLLVAGRTDSGASQDGGLDGLDQRHEDDPRPGRQRDGHN